MVKKLYLITILFLFTSFYSFADDCYEAFTEAKFYYNNSDYKTAKELFEYVKRECGEDYGYAIDWIKKCDDALIARLSVSKSSINVGYSSGTETITVTSNRNWVLRHTDSNMFSVSRNGNNITIQYYSNFSTNSRRDYFDVETSDGSKSVRIYVEQQGKAPSPSLSVSKSEISASASGVTEYITVTCNTQWDIEYPSGNMYKVTRNGNILTVVIHKNESTDKRNDYFNVKTTNGTKVQKISLSQSGKSTYSNSSAIIHRIWVDYDVFMYNQKGMRIHVKFDASNVYKHQIQVCVYFHRGSNGGALYGIYGSNYVTPDGKVCVSEKTTADYTNTTWNDFALFMPYNYLNMPSGSCKNLPMEGQVGIYDITTNKWLTSTYEKFTFTFSN